MNDKYSEKLCRLIRILLVVAIAGFLCWRFRNVLAYVIIAALVMVLADPIFYAVRKIQVKGHQCPAWLASVLSIIVVFAVFGGVLTTVIPLVSDVCSDISAANVNDIAQAATVPLSTLNGWIVSTFPGVGPDFRVESAVLAQLQKLYDVSGFSSVIGSVTSFIASIGVTLFSVVFISFFFIKDPTLITRIVTALVPDSYEDKVRESLTSIHKLMTRYFVGMSIEVMAVSFLNFIGLLFIARMGLSYSLGIAFMTGILNIIPYLGPLFGGIIGIVISLVIKYACVTSFGLNVSFGAFVLILAAIFAFTQLVDNYVYQPLIYSNSVKVHPLEIFIVFLIAGSMGGMVGMLIAIPGYTVLREIAKQFLGNVKFVRKLTGLDES